jgi:hypothetical protein
MVRQFIRLWKFDNQSYDNTYPPPPVLKCKIKIQSGLESKSHILKQICTRLLDRIQTMLQAKHIQFVGLTLLHQEKGQPSTTRSMKGGKSWGENCLNLNSAPILHVYIYYIKLTNLLIICMYIFINLSESHTILLICVPWISSKDQLKEIITCNIN